MLQVQKREYPDINHNKFNDSVIEDVYNNYYQQKQMHVTPASIDEHQLFFFKLINCKDEQG